MSLDFFCHDTRVVQWVLIITLVDIDPLDGYGCSTCELVCLFFSNFGVGIVVPEVQHFYKSCLLYLSSKTCPVVASKKTGLPLLLTYSTRVFRVRSSSSSSSMSRPNTIWSVSGSCVGGGISREGACELAKCPKHNGLVIVFAARMTKLTVNKGSYSGP